MNLHTTNADEDGSTTVFSPQGNVVEETDATGVAIFAAPGTAAVASLPIWYAPAISASYFTDLVNNPNFVTIAHGIATIKMYEILLSSPDATLKSFFSYLAANNIKLAIEGLPLTAAAGQPGYGIESFGGSGDLTSLVTQIKTLGGTLSSIAWDEPLTYGNLVTGIYTVSQTAALVAQATSAVKAIFPQVQVGDIESVGTNAPSAATLQEFFADYAADNGAGFNTFEADVATYGAGWQSQLADTITLAHANGMTIGVLIDGSGTATTATDWATQADVNAERILSTATLRPDYLIVQSWQTLTSTSSNPTIAGTLASVEADVAASQQAALAVSAIAHFTTGGTLTDVDWTGGWSATENGTNLVFTAPDGSVVQQIAWADVETFAFNTETATVSLTYLTPGSAAGQAQTWTTVSQIVGVTAAGFTFTNATAPVAGAAVGLTVGLSSKSQTGLAGSGETNDATPTLSGTAAANTAVTLQVDGTSVGTTTASSAGVWSLALTTALSDGVHLVEAIPAGSGAPALAAVSVDAETPAAPTLVLAQTSDTGYPGDAVTEVTKPVFTGVSDPDTQIALVINGTAISGIKTDSQGNWSYGAETAFALGTYTATATAIDAAGTSSQTTTLKVTIDTAAQEAANTAPDPLFDTEWYLLTYPDAAKAGVSAYTQYLSVGWKEGYDPNPYFSTSYYLSQNPDVAAAGIDPLTHFEQYGWEEGRNINPNQNTLAYEAANPAIPAGEDPLVYYIQGLENPATASRVGTFAPAGDDTAAIKFVSDVTVTATAGGSNYVFGQDADSVTTAAGTANTLMLGGGPDTVFSGGTDTILGGTGADTVTASGNVYMQSQGQLNFVNGAGRSIVILAGGGTIAGGAGSVSVLGGTGTMHAVGGTAGSNILEAGSGNATLVGGGNNNAYDVFVAGTAGSQTSVTTAGSADVFGGAGSATVATGASTVFGIGGAGTMVFNNGAGSYVYYGGAGAATLNEGTGSDIVVAGNGTITVNQSTGSEQIYVGKGVIDLTETQSSAKQGSTAIGLISGQAGGALYFNGFQSDLDQIYVFGYAANAVSTAVANQTVVAGGYTALNFSDGTKLYLTGVDGHATSSMFQTG